MASQPTFFVGHGNGPMPLFNDPCHKALIEHWKKLSKTIERPKAILMVSAYWEERVVTVTSGAKPGLFFDYFGFPAETYNITYNAPGDPVLADRVAGLLRANGIVCASDPLRGFDHGTFVPLKLIFPTGDIPVVQLSLVSSLNPAQHIAIGKALKPLRSEGVLIMGSGFSFHNTAALFSQYSKALEWSKAFNEALVDACVMHTGCERNDALVDWEKAPNARDSHPREEHLLPLLVVAAAAGDDEGHVILRDTVVGVESVEFRFGDFVTPSSPFVLSSPLSLPSM